MEWLFFLVEKHNSTHGIKNSFFIIACLRRQSSSQAERVFIRHQAPLLSTRTWNFVGFPSSSSSSSSISFRLLTPSRFPSIYSKIRKSCVKIIKTRKQWTNPNPKRNLDEPNLISNKIDGEKIIFSSAHLFTTMRLQNWRCWCLREKLFNYTQFLFKHSSSSGREFVMSIVEVEDENEWKPKSFFDFYLVCLNNNESKGKTNIAQTDKRHFN